MLEKLLTLPKDDFATLLRVNPAKLAGETVLPEREAYRYSMVRSLAAFLAWLVLIQFL
jgi:hypothetical protein